jgi:dihydroxy-acid dehydratase
MQGYLADGIIALAGCDKSVPAPAMALARMDAIGLVLYGGTAQPGSCSKEATSNCGGGGGGRGSLNNMLRNSKGGCGLDASVVCEAIGMFGDKTIDANTLAAIEATAIPGDSPSFSLSLFSLSLSLWFACTICVGDSLFY